MSTRTVWTICFVASLACFVWATSIHWAASIAPFVFALASFGFIFNRGEGVTGHPPRPPRRPLDDE